MATKNSGYDLLVKLLIIGDSGVGKTCLLLRFCENNFTTSHLTTIGIDFKIKTLDIDGRKIKMQIWDTAGQERFKTITQTYYKGAMGIILTYACNDRDSFNSIENWMKQIKQHANEKVCKILVGNKSDVSDRSVSYEEGKKLAESFGMKFFETSAKDSLNVTDAFYSIAKEIKESTLSPEKNDVPEGRHGGMSESVRLSVDPSQKKNKEGGGCC